MNYFIVKYFNNGIYLLNYLITEKICSRINYGDHWVLNIWSNFSSPIWTIFFTVACSFPFRIYQAEQKHNRGCTFDKEKNKTKHCGGLVFLNLGMLQKAPNFRLFWKPVPTNQATEECVVLFNSGWVKRPGSTGRSEKCVALRPEGQRCPFLYLRITFLAEVMALHPGNPFQPCHMQGGRVPVKACATEFKPTLRA